MDRSLGGKGWSLGVGPEGILEIGWVVCEVYLQSKVLTLIRAPTLVFVRTLAGSCDTTSTQTIVHCHTMHMLRSGACVSTSPCHAYQLYLFAEWT